MSKIEVNTIEPQCGTTLTLGASGDTIALASGASQTGFGRTGTVNWQTTAKTGNFTAVNGEGYFVDTSSGAITMTMPSGSAGSIVSIQDYNKTFDSNAFTVSPASGQKINGGTADGNLLISTEGQGLTFVYVDGTVGWKTVHENEFTQGGSNFINATGGTETTSGDDKIHTFTGPGTFTVNSVALCAANNEVSYVVVAGGGGAGTGSNVSGQTGGAGGGAGGFRESKSPVTPYTASPLDGRPSAPNRVTGTATAFPITVGSGGAGGCQTGPFTSGFQGTVGSNSIFSTITSAGGGKGGAGGPSPGGDGGNGGSGGGAGANNCTAGSGNTPPTTPAQGTNGNTGASNAGGAGGGATAAGGASSNCNGGDGGAGATTSISGSPVARAGGGAGGGFGSGGGGCGGAGGGGDGADGPPAGSGTAGTVNTGSGGGGAQSNSNSTPTSGGNGGSGVVIIRYKVQ